jgi:hypothetical protein
MIRIKDCKSKTTPKAAVLGSAFLLIAAATGFGQQVVNLTAGPATAAMPDGTTVPMWGYQCGAAAAGSTATCASLSGSLSAAATGALGGIYVLNGGSGYTSAPTVAISAPTGITGVTSVQATATAVVTGGQVVGFNVTSHGAGYTSAPTVTLSGGGGIGAVAATAPAWSPVVITVPFVTGGASLTINLTNNLSFTPTGGGTANAIPTSIEIVGQVGGGMGSSRTTTSSPNHVDAQGCPSWFIASNPPGTPCTAQVANASGTPPAQGPRVQSMSTEVAAVAPGTTTSIQLAWTATLKPGTYLLESGTHPSIQVPMGLIGMLVVTTAPAGATAGTAYPAVAATTKTAAIPAVLYNAEVPLEFSEVDPVQNAEVDLAVRTAGFSETAVWTRMNAFGPITALTLTNPGSGYTSTPTVTIGSPTGGSPNQATANVTVGAVVSTIAVTAGGSGYLAAPTVTIADTTGSGATAQATVVGGVVTAITVTSRGSLYTAPTISIGAPPAGGTQATATATIAGSHGVIYALTLTNAGEGYTGTPAVSITGGGGTGATATAAITLGGCGSSSTHTCYPPAVNYTPFYYLINGQAFDKTNAPRSLFAATAGVTATVPPVPVTTGIPATGTVLVRLVNAGSRMHVPSIVGSLTTGFTSGGASAVVSGFTLIAEDGNPLPNLGAPRVQTDVFMAAGKTYDVMVNVPATPTGATAPPSLPIYDRELSLSANSSVRDAGMLAYIGVNGAALPIAAGTGVFAAGKANPDAYPAIIPCGLTATTCTPFVVSDPSRGVIANDINVYGVELSTPLPTQGALTCTALPGSPLNGICANGTFTYTPLPGSTGADTFGYCANGAAAGNASLCTTVTLSASTLAGAPVAQNITYISKMSTFIKIPSPGVLSVDSDPSNLPLSVVLSPSTIAPTLTGGTLVMDASGGFTASVSGAGTTTCPTTAPAGANCFSFNYRAQNSQGRASAPATVTLVFPLPSNLQVKVLDAQLVANCNRNSTCINGLTPIGDYRWIIEEDKTFWVDPNCTTNSSITTPGCPAIVGTAGQSTIPTFGVNFHTSNMDFVAQGCTGPLSCEGGQSMLDTRPACTTPGVPAGCSATAGTHIPAVCDVGNGACRPDTTGNGFTQVLPSAVVLDPAKRYYISVLPGDAANPFPAYLGQPVCSSTGGTSTTANCGHTMSGAPVPPACNILSAAGGPNACTATSAFAPVSVLVLPTPLPTGRLSVIVFEDDFPLNGEQDGGGGNGTIAPIEPGLGGFNLVLWDTFGGLGDVTGQDTYDDFNQPLSNALAGTVDPSTGLDACPVSANPLTGPAGAGPAPASGMTGMIVTCPKYESDNHTLSPLAGQAVIANLMPEKFSVQAYPGADRIARGEQWVQTNSLDGQHPHDSFIRIGEPSYFQEYGPAGYHVAIGFANPAIINARAKDVCAGAGSPGAVGPCSNTIDGQVDVERLSRTPDQRLYPSGSRAALTWTQCWVSLGDPDGEDFMFTFCDANGNFRFANVPGGNWRLTIGDQWNDQIIDGLSTPANVGCVPAPPATTCTGGLSALHMGSVGVQQWQANIYTRVFIDDNKDGIWEPSEIGIPFLYTKVRYRDGHNANSLTTDFNGIANFNETYPLFNWYVVEADTTRYKTTGIHTVYDAGGPADGSPSCGNGTTARQCGTSTAYSYLTNSFESVPLPADLSVPGAVYCATADCAAEAAGFAAGTAKPSFSTASTGRIDPPWVIAEAWSGLTGQSNWIDFGKAPYASCPPACVNVTVIPPGGTTAITMPVGENGGIYGDTVYVSTRPFDDASQMIYQPWEPNVPHVTVNLYQEGFAADGVTPTLVMVDTTQSSSWDDWAQGFYPNSTVTGGGLKPYMSCPGQGTATAGTPNQDLFYFTLFDQPNYLDYYNGIHSTPATAPHPLPYNSQYKCYDAMHIGNQLQPAPYDGRYSFPSSLGVNPTTGAQLTVKGATNGIASSMNGTNCTICVANPDSTDHYRFGTPMLPPGKYVVQVIMPPGYEVYKEEDKNLLIGDNFIAPVTQQFGGLGTDIFILPDQASVASLYDESNSGYNPNNFQNQTTGLGLGDELSGVPGFPGFQDPVWPCVGEMRVVPDYLSLFPHVQEVAPFAGATRPLCDRKEVILQNQMSVEVKFSLFTSTHIASKFAGGITDDFTSEFDPFAPQFGEKFAPPNLAISTKDYLGNELSRVYSDHWGTYDGLTFSSWEVNPPNITGYSPSMMVQCMNDPGPILDTRATIVNSSGATVPNPTYNQMIVDPLFNPAYSNFCYEDPYMPGLTTYLDTPVVPTEAFVGAAYNSPDCSYPDATPAIAEVDGDGIGPWVSATGAKLLTITALGNQTVNNSAYSGPSANVAPFNLKTVARHYGFGATQGTGTVTIGGIPATVNSWSDTQITVTVPTGVPNCTIQQQAQYGGSAAQCGQLLITAGNGKQSIDTVTITIGGKAPTHVPASGAGSSVQGAIDAASPGDLLIIDPTCMTTGTTTSAACSSTALHAATPTQTASPASHNELLIMWKPVRLQGVGAVSSIINASAFPAGTLLDPWRRRVNCLFGLSLQGVPVTTTSGAGSYDPTGTYTCGGWTGFDGVPNNPQIDRLPLEATVGWDATQNGNLAEQLQEPSLMGAFEGAAITVLGKGVEFHGQNPWSDGNEGGAFPTGTTLLTGVGPVPTALPVGDANPYCHTGTYSSTGAFTVTSQTNPYPSDFTCNPSSIDGLGINNSSQGGGGIFAHGWAHHLQIANNRVYNNAGTLTGGISVGQGEFPTAVLQGSTTNSPPGSCSDGTGFVTNQHLPYCLQLQVNVHHNYITNNSSLGDELFSGTLSGGGGVTLCTGNDYYLFNFNWVCGNLSSGEGGALVHLGEIQNGDIEHNSILFNQSDNPTIPTNGGGIQVMGTPDTDPTCGTQIDTDCPPGLSDGTGHNLVINANLIQGNMAESGSGGGIRLQQVNGTDVATFFSQPQYWNNVSITNNMIVNNVAGWDGAGISLQDSLNVSIVNNTIASNDSLASSGVLTQSIGTPQSSAPAGNCVSAGLTTSCPQSAGVTSTQNSPLMTTSLTGLTVTCPTGTTNCTGFSNPILANNVIWQNRSFYIGVGNLGQGTLNQQKLVSLFDAFTGTAAPVQTASGQCTTGVSYWDVGVRGDTGPGNHSSGFTLNPTYSILDDTGYAATNLATNPSLVSQYCNGSRVPPTCTVADGCGGPSGYGVPPGIVDASSPNPIFSLTPAATVDEGNNWINVSWGPLATSDDSVIGGANGNYGGGNPFGNYSINAGSPAIDHVPVAQTHPSTDFFGNPRPDPGNPNTFDVGAVEFQTPAAVAILSVTGGPVAFGNVTVGTTSALAPLILHNTGTAGATAIAVAVTAPFSRPAGVPGGTCTTTLAAGATCSINVVFSPTTAGAATGTATITANVTVTGSPVALSGTGVAAAAILSVTPSPLAFGNRTVGTSTPNSTLTLSNTGTAAATGIAIGTLAAPFGVASTTCTATLAAASTCTIAVSYAPTAAVTSNASLTITATGVTVTGAPVAISGTGVAATLAVSVAPTSLTFGSTADGTTSPSQPVTVTATGTGTFTFGTLAFTAPFARAAAGGTCGATLVSPGTCTINVVFSPTTQTGTVNGTLTIPGSVTVTGSPVALHGTAAAAVSSATVSPNPLAFGSVAVGSTSSAQTFTITNTGNVPLARPTVAAPFARTGGSCGATIAVGAPACTYNVTFSPTAATSYSVPLTFAAGVTVTSTPPAPVLLTGTGVAARLALTGPVPPLNPGTPNTGTETGTVTVTYSGATGTSFVFTATPTVTGNVRFSNAGGTCTATTTLNSTTPSCTVIVQYAAGGSTTTRTGTVTVTGTPTGLTTESTSYSFPAN